MLPALCNSTVLLLLLLPFTLPPLLLLLLLLFLPGFSMGGSMAAIIVSLPARYPGPRCLLVGGARELPAGVLEDLGQCAHTATALLPLPSLHIMGAADKVVPAESSRQLANRFVTPHIIEHEQGHCIP